MQMLVSRELGKLLSEKVISKDYSCEVAENYLEGLAAVVWLFTCKKSRLHCFTL
jgi:hypothetical protein